ncbi:MAG TPA: hypothetical protein VFQ62_23285, partial [Methylomirabilota bacterium]|nr:hypothetical protein [Methylomirabilota bacterium]
MIGRALVAAALLAVAMPAVATAQVFVASKSRPQFEVGPLFVRANVTPALRPVTVDITWSVVVPGQRTLAG